MYDKLFINGSWVDSVNGQTLETINPSNEEVITKFAVATSEDVDLAVKAARNSFDSWSKTTGKERAKYLRAIASKIKDNLEEIAKLETRDNGKSLSEAKFDIGDVVGCFDYYADLAEKLDGEVNIIKDDKDGFTTKIVREPLGVVVAIVPWNFPLLMATWKVAPALAAGCSIILKPSEKTPLTAFKLAKIIEEINLPKGVFNLLPGTGIVGQALAEHSEIDKVAFTGSSAVGSKIMSYAAKDIKNIGLELGGKSPFIIFADSDLDKAVEWTMMGIFYNQGQVCSATSRVLVEKSFYPQFLERLIAEAKKIKIGDGFTEGVKLGPIIDKIQYEKILGILEKTKQDGAKIQTGGKRPEGLDKGYFLEATVVTDMKTDSNIWQEEVFGPVVCVKTFETEEEAIKLANDSKYGLGAAVMSKDLERCERVAKSFRAGIVWINCSQPTFVEAPWGGYKRSGIGRELGPWGLDNYLETKQISTFNSKEPWGWFIS